MSDDLFSSFASEPVPPLAPAAAVRARGEQRQRRIRTVVAGVATLMVLAASGAVVAIAQPAPPESTLELAEPQPTPTPSPTPTVTPTQVVTADPSPSASTSRPPSPTPARTRSTAPRPPEERPVERKPADEAPEPTRVVLDGDDLGVTRVGERQAIALAALTKALGPPEKDPEVVACLGGREFAWGRFRVTFSDGRLVGWHSTSRTLSTTSGVSVGTSVRTLERIYGSRLTVREPDPDHGFTYSVRGVDMVGELTSSQPSGQVSQLSNGACSGP